jgi:membrane-associated phospholipid phosphatase
MLEQLLELDFYIFTLINQLWAHPVLDSIMPLLRNKYFWVPAYIFIIAFFVINFRWQAVWIFIALFLVILLSDQLSSGVLKPLFERLRPCRQALLSETIRVLVHCGGGASFPSSHATNHFGLSFFLSVLMYKRIPFIFVPMFIWAAAVSYAQIYVGVHYPSDILGGAVLGILIGVSLALMTKKLIDFNKSGKNNFGSQT